MGLLPPIGTTSEESSTRRSVACKSSAMSPISSRNRIPLSASTNFPRLPFARAPVKLPPSYPNNSLSISSRGMAAQLIATSGLSLRGPVAWRRRTRQVLADPGFARDEKRYFPFLKSRGSLQSRFEDQSVQSIVGFADLDMAVDFSLAAKLRAKGEGSIFLWLLR